MTITEFFANLENASKNFRAQICLVFHMIAKYQGREFRDSGEPYLEHPIDVMRQLMDIELPQRAIIAGGLHDLLEDTEVSYNVLEEAFGKKIAFLVRAVSKEPKYRFPNKEARLQKLHQRWVTCARQDPMAIFIRFADRLHNLDTLRGLRQDPTKQERIARETLDFYVPLALGLAREIIPRRYHRFLDTYAHQMNHLASAYLQGQVRQKIISPA